MGTAAAYQIPELLELAPAELVVPYTALSELDRLVGESGRTDQARKALNVVREACDRGALHAPVTYGRLTLRIGALAEEVGHDGLDMSIADDRILALGIYLKRDQNSVVLATADFALFARAESAGLTGRYIERLGSRRVSLSHAERAGFLQTWERFLRSRNALESCDRMLAFLRCALSARILSEVRTTGEPAYVQSVVEKFDRLVKEWTADTSLWSILPAIFGLPAPQPINRLRLRSWQRPIQVGVLVHDETDEEMTKRIEIEEEAARRADGRMADSLFAHAQVIWEHISSQSGDELLGR